MSFRYDGSGIATVYDESRALADDVRELWALVIREHLAGEAVRRVLDLGCGTGRFSALLGEVLSARVVGVDSSADMLGRALAKPELARVRFVRAAAEALPLRAGAVDLVFTNLAYHHFADGPRALAECARVLAAGARLVLLTPTQETLASFLWMRFFPGAEAIDRRRMPARGGPRRDARRRDGRLRLSLAPRPVDLRSLASPARERQGGCTSIARHRYQQATER